MSQSAPAGAPEQRGGLPANRQTGRTYRICFVCLGNICRSPMAEIVTRSLLREAGSDQQVSVASAGTGDWHIGNPAHPGSVRALSAKGYDVSRSPAQQLTSSRLADYDLLIGLDPDNATDINRMLRQRQATGAPEVVLLRDFATGGARGLGVPDPYGQDQVAFDDALGLVEQPCRGLVDHLRQRLAGDVSR